MEENKKVCIKPSLGGAIQVRLGGQLNEQILSRLEYMNSITTEERKIVVVHQTNENDEIISSIKRCGCALLFRE